MNRDDWKHLEAAAKAIGSALNLSVQTLQHDEDYPQIEIAHRYYIQWSTEHKTWVSQTVEDEEIVDLQHRREWNVILKEVFKMICFEIIEPLVEAEALAQEVDADAVAKLRKVK